MWKRTQAAMISTQDGVTQDQFENSINRKLKSAFYYSVTKLCRVCVCAFNFQSKSQHVRSYPPHKRVETYILMIIVDDDGVYLCVTMHFVPMCTVLHFIWMMVETERDRERNRAFEFVSFHSHILFILVCSICLLISIYF